MTYTPTTEQVEEAWGSRYDGENTSATGKERAGYYAEFDRWLAGEIRKAQAEAWQEGYSDCMDYHLSNGLKGTETNPYTE